MINKEVAQILYDLADILEIQNVQWKPRAYRIAAQHIESLGEDLKEIYKEEGIKGLEEIPGIGEGIGEKIVEYIKTGKIKEYDKLKKQLPKGVVEMMKVPGLGPKKVMVLYKKLKITNLNQLEKYAKEEKIHKIKGFEHKSEENILTGLKVLKAGKGRFPIGEIHPFAEEIVNEIKKIGVKKIDLVGSIRRGKSTVRDIDILVVTKNKEKVMDTFVSLGKKISRGSKKASIRFDGLQADIRIFNEDEYGAAMQYFTGSKAHNVKLRQIAISKKLKLNEYGLFKGKKKVAGKTEKEIYKKLGLPSIPPELRENEGEFTKKIPSLVKYADIKGDLHVHSTYSDGDNTLKELSLTCKQRGYEYLAVTDHGSTVGVANPVTPAKMNKKIKEIKKYKNLILGAEVDILKDGKLYYKNDLLKKIDFVALAIHQGFKGDQTKRILKAMDNKHVHAIAHLTQRMFGLRDPMKMDFDKIFDKAVDNNIAIEVNCTVPRMDIDDYLIKDFVKRGGKVTIGTDSHAITQLPDMIFGVGLCRRGWCKKKDVLNTLSKEKLLKHFK